MYILSNLLLDAKFFLEFFLDLCVGLLCLDLAL